MTREEHEQLGRSLEAGVAPLLEQIASEAIDIELSAMAAGLAKLARRGGSAEPGLLEAAAVVWARLEAVRAGK